MFHQSRIRRAIFNVNFAIEVVVEQDFHSDPIGDVVERDLVNSGLEQEIVSMSWHEYLELVPGAWATKLELWRLPLRQRAPVTLQWNLSARDCVGFTK